MQTSLGNIKEEQTHWIPTSHKSKFSK